MIMTVHTSRGGVGFMLAAKSDLLPLRSVCATVKSTEMRRNSCSPQRVQQFVMRTTPRPCVPYL